MHRATGEVRREIYTLDKILNDLKFRCYDFDRLLAFAEDIVVHVNGLRLDEVSALKSLIRLIAIARNNYEGEKERVRGFPARERMEVTSPDPIYSKVKEAIESPVVQGTWGVIKSRLILSAPVIEMMKCIYLVLTVDDRDFYKAFQQMTEKYVELSQSDHIRPDVKNELKVLLIHTIIEIIEGEYEYRNTLYFCGTQWDTFSTVEKKLLIEAIDTAIRANEYRFKARDSGEWDYDSDESATLLIDGSKKAKSLELTRFLGRLPLVSLLSIRLQEIILTLNTSLHILQQLSYLPLEIRRDAIALLLRQDILDKILMTLQGNVDSDDQEIKSTTLVTLMGICQNIDFGTLESFSQCLGMIQHHNREKVLDRIGGQLEQWSELSEMNKFLLRNIHSALICPNPDVIKAGISCLRHHRMVLERYHQEIIGSLDIAIAKWSPNAENADANMINRDTFESYCPELIRLRTQFETIRSRMNPPQRQAQLFAPVNLTPNAVLFPQPRPMQFVANLAGVPPQQSLAGSNPGDGTVLPEQKSPGKF